MKKMIVLLMCCTLTMLAACGAKTETGSETGVNTESISEPESEVLTEAIPEPEKEVQTEETPEPEKEELTEATPEPAKNDTITKDQALEAIRQYCFDTNPGLKEMIASEDYTIYWDVTTDDSGEIVVLYRSYTGAEIRYYIDPESGDAHTTELVPGIIDEEQPSDETLNVRDYM